MSVQNRHGQDVERQKNLGKFYNSIDFELAYDVDLEKMRNDYRGVVVGHFMIGKSSFPVTISELNRIVETANDAINSSNKGYRLGIINRKQK
jgi:hypothetical protein